MSEENQAALVEPLDAFVQGDDQTPAEAGSEKRIQNALMICKKD